jgi:hypothetical protein
MFGDPPTRMAWFPIKEPYLAQSTPEVMVLDGMSAQSGEFGDSFKETQTGS